MAVMFLFGSETVEISNFVVDCDSRETQVFIESYLPNEWLPWMPDPDVWTLEQLLREFPDGITVLWVEEREPQDFNPDAVY